MSGWTRHQQQWLRRITARDCDQSLLSGSPTGEAGKEVPIATVGAISSLYSADARNEVPCVLNYSALSPSRPLTWTMFASTRNVSS